MGMTLKELLTKGEGTLSAQEAKALAAQCRMDLDTLYTLLEERGIKIQEEETEPGLDVEGIMAEVENAENNNDDLGIGADEDEDQGEENPADLKAAVQFTLGRCDFYRSFLKDKISHYAVFVYVCDAFVAAVGNADSFVGYAQISGVVKVESVAARHRDRRRS